MMKKSKLLRKVLAPIAFCTLAANAGDGINLTANNAGTTGIFETPNARIMPDWSMRMFVNSAKPYAYYGLAITPLPFLEANFHMTKISGIQSTNNSSLYDKSLSLKLILQKEGQYLPSVVFGADDIWGTGLFTSKYVAMGKKIGYFDFTIGYAKGRLGGQKIDTVNTTNSGSSDNTAFNFIKDLSWDGGEPFGSIVFNATPDLSLMAEYSPIEYEKDNKNAFASGSKYDLPDSKINFGAKYTVDDNSIFNISFQRGNQLSFGYTYQFGLSKNAMFTHLPDPKWKSDKKKLKEYENLDEKQLSDKLVDEIAAEKLSNVKTSVNKNKIWLEFDNTRYNNDLKAIGRAISTVDEVAPKKYDVLYATVKKHDVPIKTVKVNRQEFDSYESGKVSNDYFKNALIMTNSVESMENEFKDGKDNIYKTEGYGTDKLTYHVGPSFKTYINEKDKPFAMKVSASAMIDYDIAKGLFLKSKISHPIYNTIKDINNNSILESNKLSSRSNMLDYYQYDSTQLDRLTMDYIFRAPFGTLGKIEVGYLDLAFAGTDIEWYKSFFDDRLGLGLQYQYVYKRQVNNMLNVYDDLSYDAKFVNAHFLLSDKYDMHLGLKIGEFLGGDKGVRVDLSRSYKGFTLGAYATITNSDEVFTSEENKDYIDNGFYIKIPLDAFTYKNVKGRGDYSLSPYTRDVGQSAGTSFSLYQMNNSENNIQTMKKNIQKIIE